jgi:hypothetical protein
MWLVLLVVAGAIFVALAGILSGGIFTIILVPLAVIAIVSWAGYSALGYYGSSMRSPSETQADTAESLPHSDHTQVPSRPATPDEYVDARQHQ